MGCSFSYDVGIIGIGRVGLPLGIALSELGFKTIGIDKDESLINLVNNKKMPFFDEGCDELLLKVDFKATKDKTIIKAIRNIIITVGTPLLPAIEADLSQIYSVIDDIIEYGQRGQNIILRSTVAPKTTQSVKKYIEQKTGLAIGDGLFLSFCPERILEGRALEELRSLPQIIGAEDDESFNKARDIFIKLTQEIYRTTFVSAELVKLFNNTHRYINFAIANEFTMIAESFGQNIYDILYMANNNYPRGGIANPGLTAGACLRKDFGMLSEAIPYADILLNSWKINEYIPKFLVDTLLKKEDIYNKIVAVLGYSFKKDADDVRESLVPKLIRYLEKEAPKQIKVCEPNIKGNLEKYENYDLEYAINDADIIVIAINHSIFYKSRDVILYNIKSSAYVIDIWNVLNNGNIVFRKDKLQS